MVYSTAARAQEELHDSRSARRGRAVLLAEGKRYAVAPGGATIGRSRECDIVLADSNVSRRHAELRPLRRRLDDHRPRARPTACASTGATCAPTSRTACSSGDRVEVGTVDARFEVD